MFTEEDGNYIASYPFEAVDTMNCNTEGFGEDVAINCGGFKITGEYRITTNEYGEHTLDIDA
jgi:hypothetical protein